MWETLWKTVGNFPKNDGFPTDFSAISGKLRIFLLSEMSETDFGKLVLCKKIM